MNILVKQVALERFEVLEVLVGELRVVCEVGTVRSGVMIMPHRGNPVTFWIEDGKLVSSVPIEPCASYRMDARRKAEAAAEKAEAAPVPRKEIK